MALEVRNGAAGSDGQENRARPGKAPIGGNRDIRHLRLHGDHDDRRLQVRRQLGCVIQDLDALCRQVGDGRRSSVR